MSFIECRDLIERAVHFCVANPDSRQREQLESDIKDIKLIIKLHQGVKDFYSRQEVKGKNFFVRDGMNNRIVGLANHYCSDKYTPYYNGIDGLKDSLCHSLGCYFNNRYLDGDTRTIDALNRYLRHTSLLLENNYDISSEEIKGLEHNTTNVIEDFVPKSIHSLVESSNYYITIQELIHNPKIVHDQNYTYDHQTNRGVLYKSYKQLLGYSEEKNKKWSKISIITTIVVVIIAVVIVGAIAATLAASGGLAGIVIFAICLALILGIVILAGSTFGITYGLGDICTLRPTKRKLDNMVQRSQDYTRYPIVPRSTENQKYTTSPNTNNEDTLPDYSAVNFLPPPAYY